MRKTSSKVETGPNPSSMFIGMAVDMSWRLALAVLVPIIGGFKLDEALDMAPLLTILGFLLAMGGMALVLWQTMQAANRLPVSSVPPVSKAKKAGKA